MGHDAKGPASQKGLEFITFSAPEDGKSAAIRTRVKKHVMKDIGRTRRRPKKNRVIEVILDPRSQVGPGGIDPFANYPIPMGRSERALIANIFRDVDGTQRPMRYEWFSLGFFDAATFHIILANSAAHIDLLHGHPLGERSLEAERYHLLALESINKRLAQPTPDVTDSLISAVTGFIVHNEIIGEFDQWNLHLEGIANLIELRGGIGTVLTRELRETISWIELRGVFQQDMCPRFPLPASWSSRYNTYGQGTYITHESQNMILLWQDRFPQKTAWLRLYRDLVHFSHLTQKESSRSHEKFWIGATDAGGWPNCLIHQLLTWRPLQNESNLDSIIEEALRLASLLYLASVWRKFGVFPVRTSVILKKLQGLHSVNEVDWRNLWLFEAWTLVMGSIEADESMRSYFTQKISALAHTYSITIEGLIKQVVGVLWLPDAFPHIESIRMGSPLINNIEDI